MKSKQNIRIKVKHARETQGLSQRDLALKAGLSQGYIGAIESGRINPSINALNAIAKVLNVDSSFFLEPEAGILLDSYKDHFNTQEKEFLAKQKSRPWVTLAKEWDEEGITPEQIKELMKTVMKYYGK